MQVELIHHLLSIFFTTILQNYSISRFQSIFLLDSDSPIVGLPPLREFQNFLALIFKTFTLAFAPYPRFDVQHTSDNFLDERRNSYWIFFRIEFRFQKIILNNDLRKPEFDESKFTIPISVCAEALFKERLRSMAIVSMIQSSHSLIHTIGWLSDGFFFKCSSQHSRPNLGGLCRILMRYSPCRRIVRTLVHLLSRERSRPGGRSRH